MNVSERTFKITPSFLICPHYGANCEVGICAMAGRVASRFATCTAVSLHSVKRDNFFFQRNDFAKGRLVFSETTLQRRQYAPKIKRLFRARKT